MAGCEHHRQKSAMDCTMACCHPSDPAVTGVIVFVLPAPLMISALLHVGGAALNLVPPLTSPVFAPTTPPPRTLPLGL
jgi:hypothetical protein